MLTRPRKSQPLDLPNAELHTKIIGSDNDRYNTALFTWLFQIVHLPLFLWQNNIAEKILCERLRQACEDLKEKPQVLRNARHPDWSPSKESIWTPIHQGYDYYMFTNISNGINEFSVERFSDAAHDIFKEVLNLPYDLYPDFGISTPESLVQVAKQEVRGFLIDLLNIPSNYYLVAREGRVSISPTTEHGTYLASHSDAKNPTKLIGLSTVITSSLSEERSQIPGLLDFEDLLNNNQAKEADYQAFLEEHPHFLTAIDGRYCEVKPHICLFDANKEKLVPDFMARIQDTNIWDVIELKLPQHTVTVGDHNRRKASAQTARAIGELLRYRDFFSIRDNRSRVANQFSTSPYEPCLVLVIGRGKTSECYEWSSTVRGFPTVKIVSYDYLFQRARDCKLTIT